MCGPGGSDVRGEVALDVQVRRACIGAEVRITIAAISDAAGPAEQQDVDRRAAISRHVAAGCRPQGRRSCGRGVEQPRRTAREGAAASCGAS